MADESLLTDELRAYQGRTGPETVVTVTPEAVQRSLGVYGRAGGVQFEPGAVVPGYALMSLEREGEVEELRIPEPLPQSVLVSNEFSLERPLRLGERLRARSLIADISERLGGRFGQGIYVRREVTFMDDEGAVVGRTASTLMYYRADADREAGP